MKRFAWLIAIACVLLLNVAAHFCVIRRDLTDDSRYSLSPATVQLLDSLHSPLHVTLYLNGDLNPSFTRLRNAAQEMLEELHARNSDIRWNVLSEDELTALAERQDIVFQPIVVHEREKNGTTVRHTVYPYALVQCNGRNALVNLLQNNRGRSGEENLNASIENLEYAFAEAIHRVQQTDIPRIAFIEGHGELPEQNVYDLSLALSKYFQIDRGSIGSDAQALDPYRAIIIADPQGAFSEADKYVIDRYVQQGGNVLWVVNGVQFSQDVLAESGFTPVLPLDLNLSDMFFRYGVRVNPALVQDMQCLPIPVNVSSDPQQPNLQPMPWQYAPLLLTSQGSAITRNLGQVSSMFVSPIDLVGDESLRKDILLATSTASRLIPTPAEVDLADMNPDRETFRYQYIPVAVALEGVFPSVFAHRMMPDGIDPATASKPATPQVSRQVVVASGSIIRNEVQQGQALPAGYDRYSGMQFSNRDFLVNAVLYLTDAQGLISLRQKTVALRLLNDRRAHDARTNIQLISTLVPVCLLALIGLIVNLIKRNLYAVPYARRQQP